LLKKYVIKFFDFWPLTEPLCNGQYEFLKVPFGLTNSPRVFQRHVNAIFLDLTQSGIAILYVDDIIVPAADEGEAVANLKTVVKRCEEYGCFLKKNIEFLGHCIENQSMTRRKL